MSIDSKTMKEKETETFNSIMANFENILNLKQHIEEDNQLTIEIKEIYAKIDKITELIKTVSNQLFDLEGEESLKTRETIQKQMFEQRTLFKNLETSLEKQKHLKNLLEIRDSLLSKEQSLKDFAAYFSTKQEFGEFTSNLVETLNSIKDEQDQENRYAKLDQLLFKVKDDFYNFFEELTEKVVSLEKEKKKSVNYSITPATSEIYDFYRENGGENIFDLDTDDFLEGLDRPSKEETKKKSSSPKMGGGF